MEMARNVACEPFTPSFLTSEILYQRRDPENEKNEEEQADDAHTPTHSTHHVCHIVHHTGTLVPDAHRHDNRPSHYISGRRGASGAWGQKQNVKYV